MRIKVCGNDLYVFYTDGTADKFAISDVSEEEIRTRIREKDSSLTPDDIENALNNSEVIDTADADAVAAVEEEYANAADEEIDLGDDLDDDDDLYDDDDDLTEDDPEEHRKGHALRNAGLAAAGIGALVGAGFAGHAIGNAIENSRSVDNANDSDQDAQEDAELAGQTTATDDQTQEEQTQADTAAIVDYDTATFAELMSSMDENDERRIVSEEAMQLVQTFHEQTHKEGNFRMEEDGTAYLDLSYEEALTLVTFANYSNPADLYEILGDYDITPTEAEQYLESAREKVITYYMNSVEPSGLAEIFHSDADRAFFTQFENDVLTFNKEHTTQASDQVIRDVYYNYVLDDATRDTDTGTLCRILSFDTVYGGLNLVESADVDHTQFLVFHGNDREVEQQYLAEHVYGISFDQMSEAQRENVIESGTELVDLLDNGQVMNEENSTQEERDAEASLTEIVDQNGLCNKMHEEMTSILTGLDTAQITYGATANTQMIAVHQNLVNALYNAGEEDLASEVAISLNTRLSDELLERLSSVDAVKGTVANYDTMIGSAKDTRPTMEQIIRASKAQLSQLENYAGDSKDVATLINNRRHIDEDLYLDGGVTTDTEVVYTGETTTTETTTQTETTTEEISEDELTGEEQEQVEEQQEVIQAQYDFENVFGEGQRAANLYANSNGYSFGISVTDPANGATYDLDDHSFAEGLAYGYAYGDYTVTSDNEQIQAAANAAADNYIDSLSQEERDNIAAALGTSWEDARSQIKDRYVQGYISQIQSEISTAISVGEEMKAASQAAIEQQEALNHEEETTATEGEDTTEEERQQAEEASQEATQEATEGEGETSEGEESVEETETETGTGEDIEDTTEEERQQAEEAAQEAEQETEEEIDEGEVEVPVVEGETSDYDSEEAARQAAEEEAARQDAEEAARIAAEEEAARAAAEQTAAEQSEVEVSEGEVEVPVVEEETNDHAAEEAARQAAEEEAARQAAAEEAARQAAEEEAARQAAEQEAQRQAEAEAQRLAAEEAAAAQAAAEEEAGYQKTIGTP